MRTLFTAVNPEQPMTISDPDFLYITPDKAACAPFCTEKRMSFASAIKLHRKSRGR
jgi:hypothetical protein